VAHSGFMLSMMQTPTSTGAHRTTRRRRRHGAVPDQSDRRALELTGWRTMLEYRENHIRDVDGTLLAVVARWTGEAERDRPVAGRSGRRAVQVVTATADSPAAVWAELCRSTAEMR
jgi:hypothetical protein